jgi:hypothetical protein
MSLRTRKVQKFISPAILLVKAKKKLSGFAVIQKKPSALVKGEWDHHDTGSIFLIMLQP